MTTNTSVVTVTEDAAVTFTHSRTAKKNMTAVRPEVIVSFVRPRIDKLDITTYICFRDRQTRWTLCRPPPKSAVKTKVDVSQIQWKAEANFHRLRLRSGVANRTMKQTSKPREVARSAPEVQDGDCPASFIRGIGPMTANMDVDIQSIKILRPGSRRGNHCSFTYICFKTRNIIKFM